MLSTSAHHLSVHPPRGRAPLELDRRTLNARICLLLSLQTHLFQHARFHLLVSSVTSHRVVHLPPSSRVGSKQEKLGLHPALQGDPVTPPGQLGDLVPPVCPGSSPGVSFLWDVQTSCEASRRHPNHVAVLFIVFIYHLSVIMYFLR